VTYDRVKPEEGAPAESSAEVPAEAAASWVGKRVQVEFGGEWFGAEIIADDGEKCSVKYDGEFEDEHDVPYERIQEEDET